MTPTTVSSPTLDLMPLTEREEHQAAVRKLAGVNAQLREARAELDQLRAARRAEQEQTAEAGPIGRARALLAGGKPAPRGERLRARVLELDAAVQDLLEAQRLGQEELRSVKSRMSRRAAEELQDASLAIARRMVTALEQLHEMAIEEQEVRAAFRAAGYEDNSLPLLSHTQFRLDGPTLAREAAERAQAAGVRVALLDR